MSIKTTLMDDLKAAMRAGDSETRNTLRLLQAAIKQVEVDEGRQLNDQDVLQVLQKQAKMRRESIAEYDNAGRSELATTEREELVVIERYLPTMMARDEIRALAQQTITETGVSDIRGMGQVMGRLMPQLKGKAEGSLVNEVVRELLQA